MITLYSQVQRPLTIAEADGNIADLDARLDAIEQRGLQGVTLVGIAYDDVESTLTYTYSDGSVWGPYRLPQTAFNPRGVWTTATPYLIRDYVTVDGASYIATAGHVSGASFNDDFLAGKWQLNSQRGANGKDGAPFATYVGLYDASRAYKQGEMVFAASNGVFDLWRAIMDLPVGTAPGTLQPNGTPYWTQQSSNLTAEYGASVSGKPAAGAVVLRRRFARSQSFLSNLAGAVAALGTPPAASFKLSVRRNGVEFGTINWAAGAAAPTFAGSVTFAIGDVLTVVAPATQDANAADLDVTLLTYPV